MCEREEEEEEEEEEGCWRSEQVQDYNRKQNLLHLCSCIEICNVSLDLCCCCVKVLSF
ncbi:MAG: hypothetical protein K6253_00550 [Candidatus Liberibacter asiaticus]|nr:hypothetical protein [Candidatus Liberibacter asiaticus]